MTRPQINRSLPLGAFQRVASDENSEVTELLMQIPVQLVHVFSVDASHILQLKGDPARMLVVHDLLEKIMRPRVVKDKVAYTDAAVGPRLLVGEIQIGIK